MNQYRAGTIAYTSVLSAKISALAAEQAANEIDGLQISSAVGLVKALGGGWIANLSLPLKDKDINQVNN
ncbi:hypothetical protein [Legionella sp.]|uniref:hypothetical protein n=1 Tax=Legionella sp. TaxID=459 RepID=UPI003C8E1BB4